MNVIERYPIVWRNSRKGTYSRSLKSEKVNPAAKYETTVVEMRYGNETKFAICKRYKFYKYEELTSQPIEMLDLGTRGENTLKRNKISTIGQLVDRLPEIHKMRNLGFTTIKRIQDSLRAFYIMWLNNHHPEQIKTIDDVTYGDDVNE